jgi:predicted RNA-binding protein with PIN domain
MPIIIDAWNFIRDENSIIDDTRGSGLEVAGELISCLEAFQTTHNDPIILVFDSRTAFLDVPCRKNAKFAVVATRNADEYIKKYVEKVPEKQRRNLRVVSSDTDVYYHAKSSYATAIRCGEFWSKVRKCVKEVHVSRKDLE